MANAHYTREEIDVRVNALLEPEDLELLDENAIEGIVENAEESYVDYLESQSKREMCMDTAIEIWLENAYRKKPFKPSFDYTD